MIKPSVLLYEGRYAKRWHVLPRNKWFNIYLHKFEGPDPGRHLHDHPWWNISFILKGMYHETTPERMYLRTAGDIIRRKATDLHRIDTIGGPTWTLFITGPRE